MYLGENPPPQYIEGAFQFHSLFSPSLLFSPILILMVMALSHCTRRFFSLSSFKSAVRPINHSPLLNANVPRRPFSPFIRTCVYQLGGVQSLLPLHSTVATARMVSSLSIDSSSCEALLQATLCCNYLGP